MRSAGPILAVLLSVGAFPAEVRAIGQDRYVAAPGSGGFPLVDGTTAVPLQVDGADFPGVVRAVRDLQADINRVTGITPRLIRL